MTTTKVTKGFVDSQRLLQQLRQAPPMGRVLRIDFRCHHEKEGCTEASEAKYMQEAKAILSQE